MAQHTTDVQVLFTNYEPDHFMQVVVDSLATELGYGFDHISFGNQQSFLFFASEDMLERHSERGYHLDETGRGCFSVEIAEVSVELAGSCQSSGSKPTAAAPTKNSFPAHLFLQRISRLTLTLPASPAQSDFSFAVQKLFHQAFNTSDQRFTATLPQSLPDNTSGPRVLDSEP